MNPLDYIPPGFAAEDAIALAVGLGALLSLVAVWQALLVRDPVGPRLRAVAERRANLKAEMISRAGRRQPPSGQADFMRGVVDRLNLLRSREANKAQAALARAGFRSRDAVVTYLFLRLILPFLFGGAAIASIMWLRLFPVPDQFALPVAMVAALLGSMAPAIYTKNAADKRKAEIQKGLPDALDLMVICAECGLSLDATLERVAREIAPSAPELADELALAAAELAFLPDRRVALDNLADRTDLPSIRGVVNTLKQTERYGTPLAQSLRVLGAEFRNDRMMKAEEKAARLPATLTVPMIVFILPTLFIVLIGPAILKVLAMK